MDVEEVRRRLGRTIPTLPIEALWSLVAYIERLEAVAKAAREADAVLFTLSDHAAIRALYAALGELDALARERAD